MKNNDIISGKTILFTNWNLLMFAMTILKSFYIKFKASLYNMLIKI